MDSAAIRRNPSLALAYRAALCCMSSVYLFRITQALEGVSSQVVTLLGQATEGCQGRNGARLEEDRRRRTQIYEKRRSIRGTRQAEGETCSVRPKTGQEAAAPQRRKAPQHQALRGRKQQRSRTARDAWRNTPKKRARQPGPSPGPSSSHPVIGPNKSMAAVACVRQERDAATCVVVRSRRR